MSKLILVLRQLLQLDTLFFGNAKQELQLIYCNVFNSLQEQKKKTQNTLIYHIYGIVSPAICIVFIWIIARYLCKIIHLYARR